MVSLRCKMIVEQELGKLGIAHAIVELGSVELFKEISEEQRCALKMELLKCGLELLDDKKNILVERIKNVVIEMIHYNHALPKVNFSDYLSQKLSLDYTYLSNIFSEVKGITIQQFIILHKIEKIKELLLYDELSLKEIAFQLHYSSIAHLSNQFKKITGLTPSYYKQLKQKRTQNLENL